MEMEQEVLVVRGVSELTEFSGLAYRAAALDADCAVAGFLLPAPEVPAHHRAS